MLYTDSDPAMLVAVQVIYLQTHHLLCIYHITENVKKKIRSILRDEMVKDFVKDFYHMCNNYNQYQFELRYNEMLIKYEPYFERKLYSYES